jgi:hypothetical protein
LPILLGKFQIQDALEFLELTMGGKCQSSPVMMKMAIIDILGAILELSSRIPERRRSPTLHLHGYLF